MQHQNPARKHFYHQHVVLDEDARGIACLVEIHSRGAHIRGLFDRRATEGSSSRTKADSVSMVSVKSSIYRWPALNGGAQ